MKKREFFKRLLGITAAAVVAPKVLLAEEEEPVAVDPKSMKSYVSSIDFLDQREVLDDRMYHGMIRRILSISDHYATLVVSGLYLRSGDFVQIYREGKKIGTVYYVQSVSNFGESQNVRILSNTPDKMNIVLNDMVVQFASSYA